MIFQQVLWLSPDGGLRGPSDILIRGGRIAAIADHLPEESDGERLDGRSRLLLPAFANPHCHVPMTLLRGAGEGLPLQRWLTEKIFPFEALLSEDDVYWGALLGIAEMLASGCVSFSDMYMRERGLIRAVEESGIKANLCNGMTAFNGETRFEETSSWPDTQALLEAQQRIPDRRLICDLSIHGEYTSNENAVRSTIQKAKDLGLRLQIHLSETEREHREAKERRGMTPLAYFRRCGALECPVTFAHAVWLEDSDFAILKDSMAKGADITLVHNPSSNLKLGSGFADLKRWFETGVHVTVGTDGPASNNNLDMLEELTLAALLQKGLSRDPAFMDPVTVFRLGSENGFRSQGRLDSGRIEEGARADLVMINLDLPAMQPLHDPLSNTLFAGGSQAVCLTMADGYILYRDGLWLSLDIEKVKQEVARIAAEKMQQLQEA